jgi:hypothetical protein
MTKKNPEAFHRLWGDGPKPILKLNALISVTDEYVKL